MAGCEKDCGIPTMVAFLFGVSVAFNVVFIGFWAYGMYMDKKLKREAIELMNTQMMSSKNYKNWMYEV